MKPLAALASLMTAVLVIGALVASDVVDLPGDWRARLGLAQKTPNEPCRLGLYRDSPRSPPAPAGHWDFEPEMPKTQVEGSAVAIGPVIYTAGGSRPGNLHTFLALDTRDGQWSEPSRLPVGLNHIAAASYRGDLYLAGGYLEGVDATSNFWKYEPGSNRWTELSPMGRPRGAAAAAVIGDRLYVVDGAPQTYGIGNPGGPYRDLEIFDFEAGSWSHGPEPPIAVHHLGAASLGGKLYIAGGRTDPEVSSDEFFDYDPGTKRWERLPSMPSGRYSSLGMVATAGKVVVFGGDDELGWQEGGGSVTPSAWAFDPGTERWQRLPDLSIERHALGAAATADRVYALGGSYCPGLKPNGPVGTHTVESLPVSALNGG